MRSRYGTASNDHHQGRTKRMQASWAVGIGKRRSGFFAAALHGLSGGWKSKGCIESFPDGVTAFSAGGPPCGWNLGIPWSHPVATWVAGRLAQDLSDPFVDTTMQ